MVVSIHIIKANSRRKQRWRYSKVREWDPNKNNHNDFFILDSNRLILGSPSHWNPVNYEELD